MGRQSGSIIENMSGKKISFVLLGSSAALFLSFLSGALIAPKPNSSENYLGTKCIDSSGGSNSQKWFIPRGVGKCESLYDWRERSGLTGNHIVFAFMLPHSKENIPLDYSRWQQSLLGLLSFDIEIERHSEIEAAVPLFLEARIGYRNKGDESQDWKELVSSSTTRTLICDSVNSSSLSEGHHYNCSAIPLFDLSSLHHDYYLLNLRLPSFDSSSKTLLRNDKLGKVVDIWLITILQNGGFTKVWLTLKSIFFPSLLLSLVWFSKRLFSLSRRSNLLEKSLFLLGSSLSLLNAPFELLSLHFDVPWMSLLNDVKQGLFYASLSVFWMIFVGEHDFTSASSSASDPYTQSGNSLAPYIKKLSCVLLSCLSLVLFDLVERGSQLRDPFYSIWVFEPGASFAMSFLCLASLSSFLYFIFLSSLILRVLSGIRQKNVSLSAMSSVRRIAYEGMIWRFRFLLILTLVTALLTLFAFLYSQVSETQLSSGGGGSGKLNLEYSSGLLTGIYGLWNTYVFLLLFLYAPSHKKWSSGYEDESEPVNTGDEIEFTVQSGSSVQSSELSSLTSFIRHQAVD